MLFALHRFTSAAALYLTRRAPLRRPRFVSSLAAAMDGHRSSSLVVLCAKSAEEHDVAVTLKTRTDGLHLLVDGQEEAIKVELQSETDPINHNAFNPQRYMDALSTARFGRLLVWSPRLSSTHDLVSQNFSEIPRGSACIADVQFKGRGRAKNVWDSPPGCLLFSYTLEMEDGRKLPLLQYVVSLAMTEAIKELCRAKGSQPLDVRIKWPNDLYLNGLKLGGILCTSTYRSKKFNVCAGVGLNLDNEKPTTCINVALEEKGSAPHLLKREEVLASFFNKFEALYTIFLNQGFQVFQELYYDTWLHSGQKVVIEEKIEGNSIQETVVTIQGLTPSGYLLAIGEDQKNYELHPDGNSFDFFKGLVRRKLD